MSRFCVIQSLIKPFFICPQGNLELTENFIKLVNKSLCCFLRHHTQHTNLHSWHNFEFDFIYFFCWITRRWRRRLFTQNITHQNKIMWFNLNLSHTSLFSLIIIFSMASTLPSSSSSSNQVFFCWVEWSCKMSIIWKKSSRYECRESAHFFFECSQESFWSWISSTFFQDCERWIELKKFSKRLNVHIQKKNGKYFIGEHKSAWNFYATQLRINTYFVFCFCGSSS